MIGFLVQALIGLLILGVILWGIRQFPMDPMISRIVNVLVVVIVAIWLISLLAGFLPGGGWPGGYLHR
jgi:hypothetical protein